MEILSRQADRETDRQTDRQTDSLETETGLETRPLKLKVLQQTERQLQ